MCIKSDIIHMEATNAATTHAVKDNMRDAETNSTVETLQRSRMRIHTAKTRMTIQILFGTWWDLVSRLPIIFYCFFLDSDHPVPRRSGVDLRGAQGHAPAQPEPGAHGNGRRAVAGRRHHLLRPAGASAFSGGFCKPNAQIADGRLDVVHEAMQIRALPAIFASFLRLCRHALNPDFHT